MDNLPGRRIAILHHVIAPLVAIYGVSDSPRDSQPNTRRIDYDGAPTQQQITDAESRADAHNTLEVSSTEPVIYVTPPPGKPAETVITVTGLTSWDYRIFTSTNLRTPVLTGSVNDGNLTMSAAETGTFIIEAQGANFATGYTEVEVR